MKTIVTNKLSFRLVVLLLIGLLSFSACKTTKSPNKVAHTIKQEKLANALLWKIEGNGLTKPSYLFGTIHLISSEDYFLPKGLLTAIESVEKMYFEIDVDEMSDMSKIMGIMDKAMMKDNLSLKDLLSEVDYQIVEKRFGELGIPLMFMERLKPMFLEAFAGGDVDPGDLQSGKMKSYEMELNNLAKQLKIQTGGLETIEFQLGVFDSIPYKVQAEMLVNTIKSSDNIHELDELVKIYKSMNIEGMVSMIEEDEEGLLKYQDVLLDSRNKNWIPVMHTSMHLQPCLFAVGAGHLAGKNGVIRLLRKAKYKLSPVR